MTYQGVILVVARLRNKWQAMFIKLQSGEVVVVFSVSIIFGGFDVQGLSVLFIIDHGHVESRLTVECRGRGGGEDSKVTAYFKGLDSVAF